jgi:hypothetical protein
MMVSTSKSYFFLKNIGGFEASALFFGHALETVHDINIANVTLKVSDSWK